MATNAFSSVLTPELAKSLMARSMTTGIPTAELAQYGGYDAVQKAYEQAGGKYGTNEIDAGTKQQLAQQIANTGVGNLSLLKETGIPLSASAAQNLAKGGIIDSNFLASRGIQVGPSTPVQTMAPAPSAMPAAPAPATSNTNVPLYQSAAAPSYTAYSSKPFSFEEDPGYAFRKAEGEKALQAKQLAAGNFFSGGALKEAADYNSGLASQEYGNAFSRYMAKDAQDYTQHLGNYNAALSGWSAADNAGYRNNNNAYDRQWNTDQRDYARWVDDYNRKTTADNTNWGRLQYLDQSGQSAATQTGAFGQNNANNVGNLILNGGAAQAGGAINSSNAWTNALGNALYGLRTTNW